MTAVVLMRSAVIPLRSWPKRSVTTSAHTEKAYGGDATVTADTSTPERRELEVCLSQLEAEKTLKKTMERLKSPPANNYSVLNE